MRESPTTIIKNAVSSLTRKKAYELRSPSKTKKALQIMYDEYNVSN